MVAQSLALADGRRQVVALAVLLAFCSPYPIRFAIEGKSYPLLVILVALAWWCRRAQRSDPLENRGGGGGGAGVVHQAPGVQSLFCDGAASPGACDRAALNLRLAISPLPQDLWLANSGPFPALNRKLLPLQQLVEDRGSLCRDRSRDFSHARLLRCRFDAKVLPRSVHWLWLPSRPGVGAHRSGDPPAAP